MLISQLNSIMRNYKFNDKELADMRFLTIIDGQKLFYAIDKDRFNNFCLIRMNVTNSNVEDFPDIADEEVVVNCISDGDLLHNLINPEFENLRSIKMSYDPNAEADLRQVGQIPVTSKFEAMVESAKKYIDTRHREHLQGIGISSEFLTITNGHIMFYYFEDNPDIDDNPNVDDKVKATFIVYCDFFKILKNMILLDVGLYVPRAKVADKYTTCYTVCNGYHMVDNNVVYIDVFIPSKPYSDVYPNIRNVLPKEEGIEHKYKFKLSFPNIKSIQESNLKKLSDCIGYDNYKNVIDRDVYTIEFKNGNLYGYVRGFEAFVEYYSKDVLTIHDVFSDNVRDGIIINFSLNYLRTVLFTYNNPTFIIPQFTGAIKDTPPCLVEYDDECFGLFMCKRVD